MKLIGIDSGGTSCRVVLCDQTGKVLRKCTVPGHNPNADGFDALEESFRQGLSEVLADFGGLSCELAAIHVGAAGGEGGNRQILEDMLRRLLPGAKSVSVSSDALIALSAGLGRKDGGVLIAGTGTVGFLRMGEALPRFGGWGYQVDKGGSGWHLGRDGFHAAMAGYDAGLPATVLTKMYEDHLHMSMSAAIPALYRGDVTLAACAPLVFEAAREGDAVALQILRENAACLAETVSRMYKHFNAPLTVVLTGGLLREGSLYLEMLRAQVAHLPVTLMIPHQPPLFGAVAMAAAKAGLPDDPAFSENFVL